MIKKFKIIILNFFLSVHFKIFIFKKIIVDYNNLLIINLFQVYNNYKKKKVEALTWAQLNSCSSQKNNLTRPTFCHSYLNQLPLHNQQ